MALNRKDTPVGLDLEIDKIQVLIYNYLTANSCVKGDYSSYESYNRVYKNETKDGVVAETFLTGNDYKDVFMNDNVAVSSFIIANDDIEDITATRKQRTVSLIFQINLKKVYVLVPHRADSEFHNEISNALKGLKKPSVKVGAKVGINNVYSEFEVQKLKDKFHDMQPYHVFRQDIEVQYDYDCCPIFATNGITCSIFVSVSVTDETTAGSEDGTATANQSGEAVTGQVSYLWSGPNGFNSTSKEIINLEAGEYSVVVTDLNIDLCTVEGSGTVEAGTFSFGNALKYDGVNDSVDHTTINIGSGDDFVYSIWFNTEDLTGRVMASGSSQNGLTINTSTELRCFMESTVYDFTVPEMSINTWYMATFSRISGTLRVYLGDTESSTGGLSAIKVTMFNMIGSFSNPAAGWKGLLDKPAVKVGVGITPLQVSSLYNNGNGANFDDVISNPTAHWRYTESGTDSIAVDITGNFNGTLTNFIFTPSPWIPHI